MADILLFNGRITTLDPANPSATAVAIDNGQFTAVGSDADVMGRRGPETVVMDLHGRTVIPGLNDSHIHVIRGGLHYNLELRWDGVPSLADALRMLKVFNRALLSGEPTLEPRMTAVPVRLPLPPAAHEGSIYENQTGGSRFFFEKAGGR
jgi:predicted amidohydrolase YtcJ